MSTARQFARSLAHGAAMILCSTVIAACDDSPPPVEPITTDRRVSGTTRCGPAGGTFVSLIAVQGTTPTPIPPTGAYDLVELPVAREQLGTQTFTIGNAAANATAKRCLANGTCTAAASGNVSTASTSVEGPFAVTMRIKWSATDSLFVNTTADWRPMLILCI